MGKIPQTCSLIVFKMHLKQLIVYLGRWNLDFQIRRTKIIKTMKILGGLGGVKKAFAIYVRLISQLQPVSRETRLRTTSCLGPKLGGCPCIGVASHVERRRGPAVSWVAPGRKTICRTCTPYFCFWLVCKKRGACPVVQGNTCITKQQTPLKSSTPGPQ